MDSTSCGRMYLTSSMTDTMVVKNHHGSWFHYNSLVVNWIIYFLLKDMVSASELLQLCLIWIQL